MYSTAKSFENESSILKITILKNGSLKINFKIYHNLIYISFLLKFE